MPTRAFLAVVAEVGQIWDLPASTLGGKCGRWDVLAGCTNYTYTSYWLQCVCVCLGVGMGVGVGVGVCVGVA